MDDTNVKAVPEWSIAHGIKDLYNFMGLACFNQHFIWGFSVIAAPLTALLKKDPKRLISNNNFH